MDSELYYLQEYEGEYLQLKRFQMLNFHLQKDGVELMPITMAELMEKSKDNRLTNIIIFTSDLREKELFQKNRVQLNTLIRKKLIVIFHYTSFDWRPSVDEIRLYNHIYIPLPVKISEAIELMYGELRKMDQLYKDTVVDF
jgi:hypothetical protein